VGYGSGPLAYSTGQVQGARLGECVRRDYDGIQPA
jgi:hypothetical protein